jgi:uncharacterized protein
VSLPLPLRNRLAELILGALHDRVAREGLAALAAVCDDPRASASDGSMPEAFPAELFEARGSEWRLRSGFRTHTAEWCARARRGWEVVRARPLAPADGPLENTLAEARALFDAGLYFEVHEHLEPRWFRASGGERETLRGLIQVAVGFQHLANGNVAGARLLLVEGAARLRGQRIGDMETDAFARGAEQCGRMLEAAGATAAAQFDWAAVPSFPRHPDA